MKVWARYGDEETVDAVYPVPGGWLDGALASHGGDIGRTVIGASPRGAVMSHALGLGSGRPTPAGIVALSGFMPTVEGLTLDLEGRAGSPVAIGHGTEDPVIGVEWGRDARERLEAAGAVVSYRESPMAHTIDPGYLGELRTWLEAALERAGAAPGG